MKSPFESPLRCAFLPIFSSIQRREEWNCRKLAENKSTVHVQMSQILLFFWIRTLEPDLHSTCGFLYSNKCRQDGILMVYTSCTYDLTTGTSLSFILFSYFVCFFLFLGNIMKSGSTDEHSVPIQHSSLLHQKLYESHAEFWTSLNTHCQVGSFLDSFLKKMHVFKNPIVFSVLKGTVQRDGSGRN